jgi:hypothetical protein
MGINVLLFVVVQIGLEPWRRARLVRGFEEKVKEAVSQIAQPKSFRDEIIKQLPQQSTVEEPTIEHDTSGIAPSEEKHDEGEGVQEVALNDDDGEIQILETEAREYIPEKKDIWISAAGGAVVGGLLTALGTWFISR